jgi:hypothetical protein
MRKSILLIIMFVGLNCAIGPNQGFLYTGTNFAGEVNPYHNKIGSKKAEGCTHRILGLVSFGSANAGGIALENKIQYIYGTDHSTISVLTFVYNNYCTIIHGE